MTSKRKLFGALAFSAALAGGGVAGALLGSPATSGAQDSTTTTVASSSTANHVRRPAVRRAARAVRQARLAGIQAAAKVLGITPQELRTELRSGKSIADVANEKNVPVQSVIDAIVNVEKTRLEAEITKLPDQVTTLVNRKGGPAPAAAGGGTPAS